MAILYLTRNRFTRIPGQSWSKHNIIEYIRLVPKESYGIAIQNLLLIPCSETEMCTPIGSLLTTVLLPPNDLVRAAVNDNSNHDHNDTHITQQNTHTEVEIRQVSSPVRFNVWILFACLVCTLIG
jgi:hypothetical protein